MIWRLIKQISYKKQNNLILLFIIDLFRSRNKPTLYVLLNKLAKFENYEYLKLEIYFVHYKLRSAVFIFESFSLDLPLITELHEQTQLRVQ